MACICIAFVFWLLIKLSKPFESEKVFQIIYHVPESKTLVEAVPTSIKASIKGIGWDLISYYFKSNSSVISFTLEDRPRFLINSNLLFQKIAEQIATNGLELSKINPDNILIELENKVEKKIPLVLQADLHFVPQYFLKDSSKLIPDSVLIAGPSTKIESINSWSTEYKEIKDLKTSCTLEIDLEKTNDPQISLKPQKVKLELEVEQFTQKTLFLPILVKNAPDSLNIFPSKVKLNCTVGLSRYEQLSPSDFLVEVDLKNISPSTENNTATIHLIKAPKYIKNVNFSPKAVEYFIIQN